MLVSPSLLAADFSRLETEVKKVHTADLLHIDIMDGHFVPNISMGPAVVAAIRDKTDLPFDVHLMLEHPIRYIEGFVKAGADIISVHPEASDDVDEALDLIKSFGIKAGLALNPGTKASEVFPYAEKLSTVILMTVEPGFGGQKMMTAPLEKAKEIKDRYPHINIEVDGGVNRQTAHLCKAAGVDIVVAGTAVFAADNPDEEIAFFKSI